ncbi:MAG: hypothetical protein ACYSWP_14985 [Planctomycetota bacterium]|jgi:hypothetical protein
MTELDVHVLPPLEYPTTHAVNIDVGWIEITAIVPNPPLNIANGPIWVSFMSNIDWYVIFSTNATDPIPNPVILDRDPAAGVCWRVPANFEFMRKIDVTNNRCKVVSSTEGVLRWTIASKQGL